MNFGEWLSYVESFDVDLEGPFISPDDIPDDIFGLGSNQIKRLFIYLGKDVVSGGKLYTSDSDNNNFRNHVDFSSFQKLTNKNLTFILSSFVLLSRNIDQFPILPIKSCLIPFTL